MLAFITDREFRLEVETSDAALQRKIKDIMRGKTAQLSTTLQLQFKYGQITISLPKRVSSPRPTAPASTTRPVHIPARENNRSTTLKKSTITSSPSLTRLYTPLVET